MNEAQEQYITLFQEGDGRVDLQHYASGSYPQIDFWQKEREVLDYIASLQGDGRLYQERVWDLRFNGKYCIPLLEIFSRHAVSKWFVEQLNVVLEVAGLPSTTRHALTLAGFIGFWDAEGSSSNIPQLSAWQKDREILDIICEMFGGGVKRHEEQYYWYLYGDKARELTKIIMEKSHCPAKLERLRKNFEGPTYYELHAEEQRALHRQNYIEHADERKLYRERRNAEKKLVSDYIKTHPEVAKKYGY